MALVASAIAPLKTQYFEVEQILVLIKVADDIAAKLKPSFQKGDTVVFVGDTAGWIYETWTRLGHSSSFKSQHISISATGGLLKNKHRKPPEKYLPRTGEKDPAKLVDARDLLFKNGWRQAFPQGPSGTIWLVDHSMPPPGGNSSIDGVAMLLEHFRKRKCPEKAMVCKLLRLMEPKNIGRKYGPYANVNLAYEIPVPDPPNHRRSNPPFEEMLGDHNQRTFPRYCPVYGVDAWNTPLEVLWRIHRDPNSEFGRKYRAAQAELKEVVAYYKAGTGFKRAVERKKAQNHGTSGPSTMTGSAPASAKAPVKGPALPIPRPPTLPPKRPLASSAAGTGTTQTPRVKKPKSGTGGQGDVTRK